MENILVFILLFIAITLGYARKIDLVKNDTQNDVQKSTEKEEVQFQRAEVVRVKDGDTVEVDVGGEEKTIRMIGIDTPESVHPDKSKNSEKGKAASEYTKKHLKKGKIVYLEYDTERTDKYGRTLAYIWLEKNADTTSYEDFCKYNYGAILLQNTNCQAKYFAPNGKYREWYEKLEEEK